MGQQLPFVEGRSRSSANSCGVSWIRSPSRWTSRFSRSIRVLLTDLDHRLARRDRPPERRSQAREELVDPERLGHVVVGAGVQSGDLLAVPRRRPRGSRSGPASSRKCSRQTSTPLLSGSTRSRMTASGVRTAACVSAASPVDAVSTSRRRAPRRVVCRARTICGSSSTTRTRGPLKRAPSIGCNRKRDDEAGSRGGPARLRRSNRSRARTPARSRGPGRARAGATGRTALERLEQAAPGRLRRRLAEVDDADEHGIVTLLRRQPHGDPTATRT